MKTFSSRLPIAKQPRVGRRRRVAANRRVSGRLRTANAKGSVRGQDRHGRSLLQLKSQSAMVKWSTYILLRIRAGDLAAECAREAFCN